MLNVRAWLAAWFAKKAPDVSLADSHNFFEAEAIDSFGVIELVEDAEREFGIRFTARDFQDRRFSSIIGLSEIIADKKTSASI